jgi:hypothetical protein
MHARTYSVRIHARGTVTGHVTGGKGGEGEGSIYIKALYGGKHLLTVGDGDLTFSLSLAQQLACTSGIHKLVDAISTLPGTTARQRRSTLPMYFILFYFILHAGVIFCPA